MKKKLEDFWNVNINGVSVWSYFRFVHNNQRVSYYKIKLKFGFQDVISFFKFIFLRFSKVDNVIFLAGRNDLLSLLTSPPFIGGTSVVFTRYDGHDVPGNVFFIEVLRYSFRKFAYIFFMKEYKNLSAQVKYSGMDIKIHRESIKSALGDYYFNNFLAFILKGKKIYFSNCVIPKIERTHNLHDSVEVQHGVIHSSHLDYSGLPKGIFNIPLLCWGSFWYDKIKSIGFQGDLIIGPSPTLTKKNIKHYNSICIFTTVNSNFSEFVVKSAGIFGEHGLLIQKHPRDPFCYNIPSDLNVTFCKGVSPLEVRIPIIHDSTLAFICTDNNKKFIYLATDKEAQDEIEDRLNRKYNAILNRDYKIAFTPQELKYLIDYK